MVPKPNVSATISLKTMTIPAKAQKKCLVRLRSANVSAMTIFLPTEHMISNVFANILSRNMIVSLENAQETSASNVKVLPVLGLALAVLSLANTKL